MAKKQTKYDKVLQHLLAGNTISSLEAIHMFNATRLSDIIFVMKKRNIDIESRTEVSSDGARYSRYWISEKWLETDRRADE